MSTSDKFIVAFLVLWVSMTIAFFAVGEVMFGWLWLGILALLGIVELISVSLTGKTISTRFRQWAQTHVWQAILLLIGMPLSLVFLVLHLAVR